MAAGPCFATMLTLSDFDFPLPPELIAQTALPDRSASRLLVVGRDPADGAVSLADRAFADIVDYLRPGDLLVFNDTRVIKARFFGHKESGGKVEVLVERVLDDRSVLAQVRASKTPPEGSTLRLADAFEVTVGPRVDQFFTLRFPAPALDLIERYGRLPLPPYIEHDRRRLRRIALPDRLCAPPGRGRGAHRRPAFRRRAVRPPRCDGSAPRLPDAARRRRHLPAGAHRKSGRAQDALGVVCDLRTQLAQAVRDTRAAGGRVIAVGTTSLRALESAARPDGQLDAGSGDTDIFHHAGLSLPAGRCA